MADESNKGNKQKQKMRRAIDPDTQGKSMRSRLFSAAPGDSGFFSPRSFGSSKLTRGVRNRGLDGRPVASQGFTSCLLDNAVLVKMLRMEMPSSFDIYCDVFITRKVRSTKHKFNKSNLILKDGKLYIRPQEQSSPTKVGRAELLVHNIVSLKLEREKKLVSCKGWIKGKGREHRVDSLTTFHIKAGSEDQAQYIAETLVLELENYATVLDINLGSFNVYNKKEKMKEHLGGLMRKRFDLFCCSKLEGSSAKLFALNNLISFLKENDSTPEAKFWELVEKEGGSSLALLKSSTSHGLKDIQFERHDTFNKRVPALLESIESLFVGNTSKDKVEVTDSYYVSQFQKGCLDESD